ncbi:DeoR/GlpR family DNA-binding transcription regulator [Loigolactobacillus binensis]|uniref:DeoR/GlpR family DNA-binding transcription regulator n=1 Tax=Loigolactobacillus binensis TaxID=2559922 RepID=A0ABW3EGF5_9LACO|nr:DeoR/GlpR family DNA-binding transcription regulator [Loigolactobacillus binensis]
MDATARKIAIIEIMKEQRSVKISLLAEKMDVTRETIRRDLSSLEQRKLIRLIRGGATLNIPTNETSYERRLRIQSKQKEKIAAAFCEYLKEGDTVYLDFGSTCLAVAKKIKQFKHLTVITNSLPIINELYKSENIQLFVLGGLARKNEGSFFGKEAQNNLKAFSINIGFFSGSGIDTRFGLSNHNMNESDLSREAIKHCQTIAVGVDHTKFGTVLPQRMIAIENIDLLISDVADKQIITDLCSRTALIQTKNEVS